MRRTRWNRVRALALSFLLAICTVLNIGGSGLPSSVAHTLHAAEAEELETTADLDTLDIGFRDNYESYIADYTEKAKPTEAYVIPGSAYTAGDQVEVVSAPDADSDSVLQTDEAGFAEWTIDIAEAGLYQIQIKYYPLEGRGASIERALSINGETPFFNAGHFIFPRVWTDEDEVRQDNRGNDLRPSQVEAPQWETAWLSDYMGYYLEPYHFHFEAGENTLRLSSVREPMLIDSLVIGQYKQAVQYAEIAAHYDAEGYSLYAGDPIRIQGEDARLKSDATLYAINDRSSPSTEPYDVSKIRLNSIGGYRWNQPGQWISWTVEAPEDGLYKLGIKARQNVSRGVYSGRRLTIDGEVPFEEAENLRFYFSTEWEMYVLGQGSERNPDPDTVDPQLVYLTEGTHEIRMEVILGEFADVIRTVEDSLYSLNEAYRSIIMLTTSNPDYYRDYRLDREMPEVIVELARQAQIIEDTGDLLISITGERG